MGGEFGREWKHIMYGWVPLLSIWNNTTLLIGYTAIQNKTTFNGICKRHSLKVLLLLITASSLLGCIPGKSQRHRSQHATGSQGHKESDTTSVQFSSVAHSCPTLCNPMGCSTPGLPVRHQLPEFTQTHVRWVGDAIQQGILAFWILQFAFNSFS